jgi:hypothetical protein
LIDDVSTRLFLGVNDFEEVWYFSKEKFEELFNWIFTLSSLGAMKMGFSIENGVDFITKYFKESFKHLKSIIEISHQSEYKLEKLTELLSDEKAGVN